MNTMIQWTYPTGKVSADYTYCSDPLLISNLIIVRDLNGTVRALKDEGKRPKQIWELPLGRLPGETFKTPFQMVCNRGGIYVARKENNSDVITIENYSLKGKLRWKSDCLPKFPLLALAPQGLLAAAGDTIQVFALRNGESLGQLTLGSRILSLAANLEGSVYAGCGDGRLVAIDLERRRVRWSFTTGLQVRAPAVVDGNRIYWGANDGHLYALDDCWEAPFLRWKFRTGSYIRQRPALASGCVYFSSWDSHVYALDADTGIERWRFRFNNYGDSDVLVDPKRQIAYFMSVYNLFAVNSESGELLAERKINRAIYSCNSPALDPKTGCLYIACGLWDRAGTVIAVHPDRIRHSQRDPTIEPIYPTTVTRDRPFVVFSTLTQEVGIKEATVLCRRSDEGPVQRFPMVRGGRRMDWGGWAGVVAKEVAEGDSLSVAIEARSVTQPDKAHQSPFHEIKIVADETPGPGWYPGDPHCHSEFYNTIPLIEQARKNGLNWIISTGHTGIAFRREMEAATTGSFVPVVGDEIGDGVGHCLSYEASSGMNPDATPQEWADQINQEGGMVFYAHCTFALDQTGWRGTANWDEGVTTKKSFGEEWSRVLNQGRRLWIIEGSDKRRDPMPCTYVYVQRLNKKEILNALARGRFFVAYPAVVPDKKNDWCWREKPLFYVMDFRVNGEMMGAEVKARKGAELEIKMKASGGRLKKLVLLRGDYTDTEIIWKRSTTSNKNSIRSTLKLPFEGPCWLRLEGFANNGALCLRSNPIFVRGSS